MLRCTTASLGLPAYAGSRVHFTDVARGCAKQALLKQRSIDDVDDELDELPVVHKVWLPDSPFQNRSERS